MIRDTETGEVVKKYELEDCCYYDYSKLLDKKSIYNHKRTEDTNVYLEPYSRLFIYNSHSCDSFNNKKFSII